MITDILDLFCFIGRLVMGLCNLIEFLDFFSSIGRFFNWSAKKIPALFSGKSATVIDRRYN